MQDMAPLEAHLGFALELPHVNRSAWQADYRDAYSPDSIARVAEMCAADIAQFGYQFET